MSDYKYKFSFVMPVYNVEEYLAETVESILAQSLNFEANCQIIFINDGSTDKSQEICRSYQRRFPNNIKYIEQTNQGVSAARNRGLKEVEGKYVSFLDSDDKISPDTLEAVYAFFEHHQAEIDFVSIKMQYFDGSSGSHMLNYKFTSSRVIDIEKQYDCVQLSGGSVFVKQAVLEKLRFDPRIGLLEDAKLLTHILLDKMSYGVVAGPTYYYRIRSNRSSAVNGKQSSRSWYFDVPEFVYEDVISISKDKLGYVPKYVQYLVAYDIQWRFKQRFQHILSGQELKRYKNSLYRLLHDINAEIIMEQKHMSLAKKLFLLEKKYGQPIDKLAERKDNSYFIKGTLIFGKSYYPPTIHISTLEIKAGQAVMEGFCRIPLLAGAHIEFKAGGESYDLKLIGEPLAREEFLGEIITDNNSFKVSLPIADGSVVTANLKIGDSSRPLNIITKRFTYLNGMSNSAYRVTKGFIIRRKMDKLIFEAYSRRRRAARELAYQLALLKRLKLSIVIVNLRKIKAGELRAQQKGNRPSSLREWIEDFRWLMVPVKSLLSNAYVIFFRLLYFLCRTFIKDKIWLISDRANAAGDNAYYLFKYAASRESSGVKLYFALDKTAAQYNELRRIGRVVNYGGFKFKLLFLLADKRISSHFDNYIINAFGTLEPSLIDLYNFDFVYLEHGVLTSDSSELFGRHHKNAKLLALAAAAEKQAILSNPYYGYSDKELKLTGAPRFDPLVSDTQPKIIFMPTWRIRLAGSVKMVMGSAQATRSYSNAFKATDYYKFFNDLITDGRLLEALERQGYEAEFYIHPSLSEQWQDFTSSQLVKVMRPPHDYVTAMRRGALMVTDYSGVAFDFAYMNKPVIYSQYDKDRLYDDHYYEEGYFSFEEQGFGPVTYDYETTVKAIIDTIESGCEMESKYQARVKQFFYKLDRNNSQRVYEAILNMDKEK